MTPWPLLTSLLLTLATPPDETAILLDGPGPWQVPTWQSAAAAMGPMLTDAGYQVVPCEPSTLLELLDREPPALVAAPSLERLPVDACRAIVAFVQSGGRLLASGGEPFAAPLYPTADGWQTAAERLEAVTATRTILVPAEARSLRRATNQPDPVPVIAYGANGPAGEATALHVRIPNLTGWDTLSTQPFPEPPFGAGEMLTIVTVKGTPGQSLALEWKERDGSRWIAELPLTSAWRRHILSPADFRFWPDGSPPARRETQFEPAEAAILGFGASTSFGALPDREVDYWLGPIETAPSPFAEPWVAPIFETISPWYKQFEAVKGKQPVRFPIARPRGLAGRAGPEGRYEPVGPLLTPFASRYLRTDGAELVWLPAPPVEKERPAVVELLAKSLRPLALLSGGPRHVAGFAGQPVAVAATVLTRGEPSAATVRWTLHRGETTVQVMSAEVTAAPGMQEVAAPEALSLEPGDYRVTTVLELAGTEVDRVDSPCRILPAEPPTGPRVAVAGDTFTVGGERLFLHGVNYRPRSVAGIEPDAYRRHWLSPVDYDPEVVEADLAAIAKLGMNLVSVQYLDPEQGRQLADFLDRCRRHGLRANVYLAGAHPLDPDLARVDRLLAAARLPGNSTVFAYDLAWEPRLGDHAARRRYDRPWRDWLQEQYGSVAAAEAAWSVEAPRNEQGEVTNPSDWQLTHDGDHRVLVAAYRRFADDWISRGYRTVTQHLRRLDPDTLLGARTGYGGTGTANANRVMAFDLLSGAAHLDFVSPEGYGLPDTFTAARPRGFITAYGRWASGGKPVFWAEFGSSIGPRGGTPATRDRQENVWSAMLQVVIDSNAAASAGWWWPGGWRVNEASDFGILDPDGTTRDAAVAESNLAAQYQDHPVRETAEPVVLSIDRDASALGLNGLLETHGTSYAEARAAGRPVQVTTAGTGTDTGSMPRVQVGDVPDEGSGPLKYANGEILSLTVRSGGADHEVINGGSLSLAAGTTATVTIEVLNTGEAIWLPSDEPGGVSLRLGERRLRLTAPVARYGRATFGPFEVTGRTELSGRLEIDGLGAFGEPLLIMP